MRRIFDSYEERLAPGEAEKFRIMQERSSEATRQLMDDLAKHDEKRHKILTALKNQ